MIWQDLIITIANIVLSLALIPQVTYGFKNKKGYIKLSASVPTFLGLYVMSTAFFTLKLYYSSTVCFISGTLWFVLFIQKLVYK